MGAALSLIAAGAAPASAEGVATPRACVAPSELVRLNYPLPRTGARLAAGLPLTIVAIGSSSTAGAGASAPAFSYPSRLEAELRAMFPRASISVINRGVGGETARDMLARFDREVFAAHPDLVLWQVGSNSVLRDQPVAPAASLLRQGLERLKAARIDVVLMNPQYAPKVLAKPEVDHMVDLIDATARETQADLFQRFAVMRYWRLTEDIPFAAFLSPDELHMNDWSYGCIAKLMATAIAEAAMRKTITATSGTGR